MLKPDSRSKAGPAQDSGFSLRVIPTAPLIVGAQASFLWTGVCSSFIFPTGVAGVTPASVLPSRVGTGMAPLNWLELEVHEPEGPPPTSLSALPSLLASSFLACCLYQHRGEARGTTSRPDGMGTNQGSTTDESLNLRALSLLGCSHHQQRFSEPKKIKSVTVSIVSPCICHELMGPDPMIFVF